MFAAANTRTRPPGSGGAASAYTDADLESVLADVTVDDLDRQKLRLKRKGALSLSEFQPSSPSAFQPSILSAIWPLFLSSFLLICLPVHFAILAFLNDVMVIENITFFSWISLWKITIPDPVFRPNVVTPLI